MIPTRYSASLQATSLALLLLGSASALADGAALDGANTAWVLTSTTLVLFMTLPGLALFYGGLVRSKNVLTVLMQCFSIACVVSILWFAIGYSIAFAPGNAWFGVSGGDDDLSRVCIRTLRRRQLS